MTAPRRVGLGLLGLSAVGLVGGCTTTEPEGIPPPAVTWTDPIGVATGPARKGPWRGNESEFRYVDDATVAIGDRGRVAVAWADQARQDVFLQVYDRAGEEVLEAPVNVSGNGSTFSWLPRVAIPEGDPTRVYVLWQEIVFSGGSHGGDLHFARSTDGGRSFEAAVNLSASRAGDGKGRLSAESWDNGSLDLALGPGGEVHAAWTEYEGALWHRRSTDGGQTFAEATLVAGNRRAPARGPSLAVQPDGVVHLAWTVGEDPGADIRVATSSDGGRTFGPPTVVGESDGHADAPKLAVGHEGTLHLVYAEAEDGPGGRAHIRYTRRLAGEDAFEPPRVVASPDAHGVDALGAPALSVDGAGNLYVVWERFPNRRGRAVGLGFARADPGARFRGQMLVPGTADADLGFNGSLQGRLMRKLAVAEDGAIAVVNSTFREGERSLVRLILGAGPENEPRRPSGRRDLGVELSGIEPPTSSLRTKRSAN